MLPNNLQERVQCQAEKLLNGITHAQNEQQRCNSKTSYQ